MTNNIITLPVSEAPLVQTDAIATLQASLGIETGRDVVERAVFEISDRLCKLELALHDGDMETVGKIAASLVCMSTQIGLQVFAEVASGLANAISHQNNVTAAALAWRLLRVGESSLFCAVELADRSG
jgi:hypothetical protein